MSSRSESLFSTASWMELMPWTVKLATSALGWMSWKESPLLVVMGLHLARKRTKPATAIKFNTSRTLTLLKEAIKLPEGHRQPPRSPQQLGKRAGSRPPLRTHRTAPHGPGSAVPRPGPELAGRAAMGSGELRLGQAAEPAPGYGPTEKMLLMLLLLS